MSSVPHPHPALLLVSVFGAFLAGPALGAVVAHAVAPGSELAQVVSPLAFVLTFAGGLLLWFGVGSVTLVGGALRRLLRRRTEEPRPRSDEMDVPPGHGVFLPLALGLGLLAGIVAGLVPEAGSFWLACGAHLAAGAAYGGALRALARQGYLPFPEPS